MDGAIVAQIHSLRTVDPPNCRSGMEWIEELVDRSNGSAIAAKLWRRRGRGQKSESGLLEPSCRTTFLSPISGVDMWRALFKLHYWHPVCAKKEANQGL